MNILGNIVYMYVLAALISFFVAFVINTIYVLIQKIKRGRAKEEEDPKAIPTIQLSNVQREAKGNVKEEEIYAAIGYAIHLYLDEIHDREKMQITIQKTIRPYSPWSSKIYGLNRYWR